MPSHLYKPLTEYTICLELHKEKKLGLINKNINKFLKSKIPKDLDHNGSELTEDFYPNVWIDAYIDRDDNRHFNRTFNTSYKVIININKNNIREKIAYLDDSFDRYEQWLNRFDMYDFYVDYINYSNNINFIYNKDSKKYYIVFTCVSLINSIYIANKIEKRINILKKWIYKYVTIYKLSVRHKKNMLYQFKCLPMCVANEIQNMYDNNLW